MFWNFSPGGTSSSKAQNPPFLQSTALNPDADRLRQQPAALDGLPAPPGVDPNRPAAGATRSIFDINFRDAYARQWNINFQRSLGTNYMVEVAYVGSQGRQMVIKVDINQAPPVVGVSDANVNRPFIGLAPAVRSLSQSQSIGKVDYNGLLLKFQRRFANNFSFLNSYTFGKSMDFASDNEAGITNTYDLAVQLGPVGLRRAAHAVIELDLRAAVGPRPVLRRLAAERHPLLARRPAADRHADAGCAVDRHRQPAEPDLRRQAGQPDDRSVGSTRRASCAITEPTGTYGDTRRGIDPRARARSTSTPR